VELPRHRPVVVRAFQRLATYLSFHHLHGLPFPGFASSMFAGRCSSCVLCLYGLYRVLNSCGDGFSSDNLEGFFELVVCQIPLISPIPRLSKSKVRIPPTTTSATKGRRIPNINGLLPFLPKDHSPMPPNQHNVSSATDFSSFAISPSRHTDAVTYTLLCQ
jgi:hypothetical protein